MVSWGHAKKGEIILWLTRNNALSFIHTNHIMCVFVHSAASKRILAIRQTPNDLQNVAPNLKKQYWSNNREKEEDNIDFIKYLHLSSGSKILYIFDPIGWVFHDPIGLFDTKKNL